MTGKSKKKIGIAVIGCGSIAQAHLDAILHENRVRLIAVADADADRANAAAKKYKAKGVYISWEPIWKNQDIEAVILCLPHHLHAPAAIDAMKKGKHVLAEKPIANNVAEADEIIEAAKIHKRVLMVGHMKRFNRATVAMQRNISAGNIGDPFSFEAIWYGPREIMPSIPWILKKKTGGGGPVMGFGTHHLDVLHWIFGEVKEVSCFTTRAVVRNSDVEDTGVLSLQFQGGVIGVIHFTFARAVKKFYEHIRILGSKGEVTVKDGREISIASEPRFGDRKLHILRADEEAGDLPEDQFAGQLAHFINCIHTGETPLTNGLSARNALVVIEAAYRSAETGTIVTVKY